MAKRKVSDRMMDLTAKIGVHPYHVSGIHALQGVQDGKLTDAECKELFSALADDADASAEEAAVN